MAGGIDIAKRGAIIISLSPTMVVDLDHLGMPVNRTF